MTTAYIRPIGPGDETGGLQQYPSSGFHWDKVDEVVSDGAATYVSSFRLGWLRDLYELGYASRMGTINWIKVWMVLSTDNVSYDGKTVIKTGGTVYEGPAHQCPSAGPWYSFSQEYVVNPKTGVAWTWDDINVLQAGVSLSAGLLTYIYCTQVYVEINSSPDPSGYPTCVCDLVEYNWSCSCFSTCYGQGCTCNNALYGVGSCKGDTSCACFFMCYEQTCTSCYNTSYNVACQCDMMKYAPGSWLFY